MYIFCRYGYGLFGTLRCRILCSMIYLPVTSAILLVFTICRRIWILSCSISQYCTFRGLPGSYFALTPLAYAGWSRTLATQLVSYVLYCSRSGVGKVRPEGQIRPASSAHPARGGSSVLTLNSPRKTYRTMSDCFHAERDLVAYW